MGEKEEGKIVLPGDFICATEEYVAGEHTYKDAGGIYSSIFGMVKFDDKAHKIDVEPKVEAPPEIKPGMIVLGEIIVLKSSFAVVGIDRVKGYEDRQVKMEGTIHISNIQDAYISGIDKGFSVGDIVKAKVVSSDPIRLTTVDENLGVIKAFCPVCGIPMEKKGKMLECPKCKNKSPRKVSSDYRTGVF